MPHITETAAPGPRSGAAIRASTPPSPGPGRCAARQSGPVPRPPTAPEAAAFAARPDLHRYPYLLR